MKVSSSTRSFFCYFLFLLAYSFYVLGQIYPVFHFKAEFSFGKSIIPEETRNLVRTIEDLWATKDYYPVALIVLFSFIIPFFKFIIGTLEVLKVPIVGFLVKKQQKKEEESSPSHAADTSLLGPSDGTYSFVEKILLKICFRFHATEILRTISKYQFVDSFMALILVAHLNSSLVTVEILIGAYYFWSYCVMSLVATQFMALCLSVPTLGVPPEDSDLYPEFFHLYPEKNLSSLPQIANAVTVDRTLVTTHNKNVSSAHELSQNSLQSTEPLGLPKHKPQQKLLRHVKVWLTVTFFSSILHVATALTALGAYLFLPVGSLGVAILNKAIDFSHSPLNGYQEVEKLWYSPYILNGFLTVLLFAIVFPVLVALVFLGVTLHMSYFSVRQKTTVESIIQKEMVAFSADAKHCLTHDGTVWSPNYTHVSFSLLDQLLYRYLERYPAVTKLVKLVNFIADWCMGDVLSLGIVSAYFVTNAIVILKYSIPDTGESISSFWIVYIYGISSFLLVNGFAYFNKQIVSLEQKLLFMKKVLAHKVETTVDHIQPSSFQSNTLGAFRPFVGRSPRQFEYPTHIRAIRPLLDTSPPQETIVPNKKQTLSFVKRVVISTSVLLAAMAVFLLLTFTVKYDRGDMSPKELEKNLNKFLPALTTSVRREVDTSYGNCSVAPAPCSDTDAIVIPADPVLVTIPWWSGIKTINLTKGFISVNSDARIEFGLTVLFDYLTIYTDIEICLSADQCQLLYNGTSLCCGDNFGLTFGFSVACNDTSPPYFSDLQLDRFSVTPVEAVINGATVNISGVLETSVPIVIDSYLKPSNQFIEWGGVNKSLIDVFNTVASENIVNNFTCPPYSIEADE